MECIELRESCMQAVEEDTGKQKETDGPTYASARVRSISSDHWATTLLPGEKIAVYKCIGKCQAQQGGHSRFSPKYRPGQAAPAATVWAPTTAFLFFPSALSMELDERADLLQRFDASANPCNEY